MGETSTASAAEKRKEKGTVIPINPEGLEHDEQPEEEENLSASYRRTVRAMFLVFLVMVVVTVAVNVNKYPEWEKPSVFAAAEAPEPASGDLSASLRETAPAAEISGSEETSDAGLPEESTASAEEGIEPSLSEESPVSGAIFPLGINTATSEELQQIPDIGPVTAEKIILYREQIGTITDFDDLLPIDGIGQKTIERLAGYCYID